MTEAERREFLKNAGAVLTGAVGIGVLSSCAKRDDADVSFLDETADRRTLKRAELVERLKKLAKSEPPKVLIGAMCYKPGPPPEKKEIPCPDCKRTKVVGEMDEILREYNVPLKRIQDQHVDAKLIVPQHCPECGFGLKEEKFRLEIKYPDQRNAVRVELETAFDLELMDHFLRGADHYEELTKHNGMVMGGQGHPLKDKVDRLKELFGVRNQQ